LIECCSSVAEQSRAVGELLTRTVIVLKLLEELDGAAYEIVKKPGNAGFTFDTPGGDGAV
jgi:hypothetical protein